MWCVRCGRRVMLWTRSLFETRQARPSFLKKRSKKLLLRCRDARLTGLALRVSAIYIALCCSMSISYGQHPAASAADQDAVIEALLKEASKSFPTDAEMTFMLRKNIGCFENVLRMAKQDRARGIWRISPVFIKTNTDFLPTNTQQHEFLPDSRWNRYRELFVCAHLDNGNGGISISASSVSFIAETRGFAGSGAAKMFVWSEKPITPVRNSLDKLFDDPRESTPNMRFKHIEGPWYLELDIN